MFQQPSQGDKFTVADHIGSLCLFFVHDVRQGVTTTFGDREAIACDIHVLGGPGAGEICQDALIFQGALIGSLRRAAGGDPVLARIAQGVAKPGQSPPFVLAEFTDADAKIAQAWIAAHPKGIQAPAGNGTQPAPPPYDTTKAYPGVTPEPAPPATGNGATVDYSALPPEVQELLKQSGAMPR